MAIDHDGHDKNPRRSAAPLSPEELAHWRECAAASPDVRVPRVLRVRRAIADCAYETQRIDRVVEVLSADLAGLCADDSFPESTSNE